MKLTVTGNKLGSHSWSLEREKKKIKGDAKGLKADVTAEAAITQISDANSSNAVPKDGLFESLR